MADEFEAAMAAKVASLDTEEGTTTEPGEATAEETIVEEPAAEAEVEETTVEKPVAEEEPARPEWLPANFKTVEAYVQSLEHRTELFDQQANELGDLRKRVDEQEADQQQVAPGQYGQIQAALEENPEQVAYWAAQKGDEQLLDNALTAWQQRAIDEGDAVALRRANQFEREIDKALLRQELSQEVLPSVQNMQRSEEKRALATARTDLAQQYPDFDTVMEAAGTEAALTAGLDPDLLDNLRKTDPKAALEMIYATASARQRATVQAATDQDREQKREQKRAATVATSTFSPAERTTRDAKQTLKDFFETPEPHSVHHGLVRE